MKNRYQKTVQSLIIIVTIFSLSLITRAQEKMRVPKDSMARNIGLQRPIFPKSPEILSDNRVIFRLLAPEANSAAVSGIWMEDQFKKSVPMTKGEDGVWTLTVGPLQPEYYGYKFMLDGATILDPANQQIRRDWLGYESILIVPGEVSQLYQARDVPAGTVAKVWYESPVIGQRRRLYIYTPPTYETSRDDYPVLYLLHGGMNDEETWLSMGRVNIIMDNLIAEGKAEPMILVMTNGNPDQVAVSFEAYPFIPKPELVGSEPMTMANGYFDKSLIKDVIPFVEKSYRTKDNKENRGIIGYSFGGYQTIKITLDNPNVFDYIGIFAGGEILEDYKDKVKGLANADPELYWIGCSVDDPIHQKITSGLIPYLKVNNIDYTFKEVSGGHGWPNWRILFSECIPYFFK